MSADNWTNCPRCLKEAEEAFQNHQRQVDGLYGKVPVEEFDKARAALIEDDEALCSPTAFLTFREDYKFFGAEDGVVTVRYKGECTKCKTKLEFREDHQIPGV